MRRYAILEKETLVNGWVSAGVSFTNSDLLLAILPLPEPMLNTDLLSNGSSGTNSSDIWNNYKAFRKYHVQNVRHFVTVSMCRYMSYQ